MDFPEDRKYTKEHEWIRIDGELGVVGITDYAQSELGDIVFVELPPIGKQVKQGDSFGTIEAVKAVSDLFSPVSGEVLEINGELEKVPETVNKDPYEGGWMVKIRFNPAGDLSHLLDAKQYREMVGK